MNLYFLDTSALVKLYIHEAGTDELIDLLGGGSNLALLSLTPVEFRSAIRRRERNRELSGADAGAVIERFSAHLETRFLRQPLTESTIDRALSFVDLYALRAYDAMQLAGYLAIRLSNSTDSVFVCSDAALLAAARSEGAMAVDPTPA